MKRKLDNLHKILEHMHDVETPFASNPHQHMQRCNMPSGIRRKQELTTASRYYMCGEMDCNICICHPSEDSRELSHIIDIWKISND